MSTISFVGGTSWTPSHNPLSRRFKRSQSQVIQETAGGARYVYDKGQAVLIHELSFSMLSAADKSGLDTFFDDTAKGSRVSFTYNDRGGAAHTVTFDTPSLAWGEPVAGTYDITLTLREEL